MRISSQATNDNHSPRAHATTPKVMVVKLQNKQLWGNKTWTAQHTTEIFLIQEEKSNKYQNWTRMLMLHKVAIRIHRPGGTTNTSQMAKKATKKTETQKMKTISKKLTINLYKNITMNTVPTCLSPKKTTNDSTISGWTSKNFKTVLRLICKRKSRNYRLWENKKPRRRLKDALSLHNSWRKSEQPIKRLQIKEI